MAQVSSTKREAELAWCRSAIAIADRAPPGAHLALRKQHAAVSLQALKCGQAADVAAGTLMRHVRSTPLL